MQALYQEISPDLNPIERQKKCSVEELFAHYVSMSHDHFIVPVLIAKCNNNS